jgi:outer membrane biosynthesis protein TonB
VAKPKPKPKPPHRLAKVKPKRKPKPPDPFASVLKTVEELKARPKTAPKKDEKKEKKEESFETMMAKALIRNAPRNNPLMRVTMSEIDYLRRQIGRCWSLPAGAKDAQDLVIEIRVAMNSDGTVNSARIMDQVRMTMDPFFRSAAESALRAVLNRRCQPFKLSPEKYDLWKNMILSFNPKEMFG